MYESPAWIEGLGITMAAGGKVSTASGYVRFPGNEPRLQAAITNGKLLLESEASSVVGTDNIATYADGSAITAGKFVKLLVGVIRDKGSLNTAKYMVVRQGKPTVEYASRAEALGDLSAAAGHSFPYAYKAAITPLCYIITVMGVGATSDYTQAAAYPSGDIIDLRESGLTGGSGGGAAVVSHGSLANLNVEADHPSYLTLDGTRALTGNWTAAKNITTVGTLSGSQLISTIADGTKPLDVTSKTVTTNLNADMVDGVHETSFLLADGTRALTGNWAAAKNITTVGDMGSVNFTATGLAKADTFQSTHAVGVAPYTATSTTVCTNVNADAVDGIQGANIVTADGLTALTGNWSAGKKITAPNFESTIAAGTAPLVVASDTVVTNLNASKLEGNAASAFAVAAKGVTNGDTHDHVGGDGAQIAHSGLSGLTSPADDHTQYLLAAGTRTLSADWNAGTKNITTTGALSGSTLVATLASGGAAPMTITSTTKVTNLNSDMLDGLHDTAFLKADGTVTLTGNLGVNANITVDGVDISAHAADANAHHNAVTLGANTSGILSLSTQAISMATTPTTSQVLAGPIVGATTPAAPTFRQLNIQDIARPSGTLTLANGANNDVALTAGTRVYTVTGPTAAYSITGFASGTDGAVLYIYNSYGGKNFTLAHESASSTAANRIITNTGADLTSTGANAYVLTYIAGTLNRWVLMSWLA
jgi:hypothetical protein